MSSVSNKRVIDDWSNVSKTVLDNFGDEGDFSRRYLLNPSIFKLLGDINGKIILDAGCGNGYLSRLLTKRGASVTGVEPAKTLIDYAMEKENKEKLGIKYFAEDLSNLSDEHKDFDVVVSNMVFMDIPNYEVAIANCIKVLKPGGIFVFSISHPAFEEFSAEYLRNGCIKVKEYFEEYEIKPTYGYSFHRPLSKYLNLIIKLNCTIKEIIEPQLDKDIADANPNELRNYHVPSFLLLKAKKN